jgi:NAD(P)-dependent dehydrogenase (short-subunit alcohol dehydrogenase family)
MSEMSDTIIIDERWVYMSTNDKIVIVTGGSSGIGKELAYAYACAKNTVIFIDINEQAGNDLQKEWMSNQLDVLFYKVDVKDEQQIIDLFDTVYQQFGKIDILINNAGIGLFKHISQTTVQEFDSIYQTNLRSCFIASREFSKRNNGSEYGRIINIASTRYLMSEPNSEAYAASKGGIVSLTHALAATLSNTNFTVNSISPGWIYTGDVAELSAQDHEQHFSKRVGTPQDIVTACMYLTEQSNNFITGQNIIIDGGMTKKMIYV